MEVHLELLESYSGSGSKCLRSLGSWSIINYNYYNMQRNNI